MAKDQGEPSALRNRTRQEVRLSELVIALSLAADLGMGQPLGWGLRGCLLAMHAAEGLELTQHERKDLYYLSLLHYLGCTTDAHLSARLFGQDRRAMQHFALTHMGAYPILEQARPSEVSRPVLPETLRDSARARCEVAMHLARWCDFGQGVQTGLWQLFERWDGSGLPNGLAGEQLSLPVRIVQIAQDAETFFRLEGLAGVKRLLAERSGKGYDPRLAAHFLDQAEALFASLEVTSLPQAVQEAEPEAIRRLPSEQCQKTLEAMADFADMKSPFTAGHARGVADLAARAATEAALDDTQVTTIKWAGLVHDLGRVRIDAAILDKPARLSDSDWEEVRLHPYYTERVLARCEPLSDVTQLAALHHERLDGSGYHRGVPATLQPFGARLLAAADAYHAMNEARAHREALRRGEAAAALKAEVKAGKLDPEAVACVLKAAGHRVRQRNRDLPGGLSPRQVEVLRLIARGHTDKEVAERLSISPKTVGHHVQHIYGKLEVSTRAAATLFAAQHHLIRDL